MWARMYLTPLLQAEEDRDQVRRHFANSAREKELLGSEQKIYHSDRYAFTIFYLRNFIRLLVFDVTNPCVYKQLRPSHHHLYPSHHSLRQGLVPILVNIPRDQLCILII